ncbi:MAG: hypothetical protein HWQ38_09295 [Nostoc sp. NMS7]|nr:hypothetical protein [Nostoc sp. NMS7]
MQLQTISQSLISEKLDIFLPKILIYFPDTQTTSFYKPNSLIMGYSLGSSQENLMLKDRQA